MIEAKPLPPPEDRYPVRRALLSVSDKAGLVPFARRLHALGIELLSTGGTARALREASLPVKDVAEVTGSPELLGGRVKTLHPKVHAGILARRTDPDDLAQLEEHGIGLIDLVVVNLYPFREATAREGVTDAEAAENVDIGGPTMVRAAAKNWFFVGVVTSPDQYDAVAGELEANGGTLGMDTRRALARAAFAHTAAYDAAITDYLDRGAGPPAAAGAQRAVSLQEGMPEAFSLSLPQAQPLRYGENPHQRAALYGQPERFYRQLHGKELSFNNLLDLSAALRLIAEFEGALPTVAILKHTNPCGVGTAGTLADAYARAFATDRQSPFGGIVVVNRPLDRAAAEAIDAVFTELVIAPGFEEGVLDFLMQKQNRRLIEIARSAREDDAPDVRSVVGGLLVQEADPALGAAEAERAGWQVATERAPTEQEWADLDFAWRVCKHVKSNAIVYARGGATLGIGAGQMSRVDSSEIAVSKGRKSGLDFAGCVVASDAFFPFADGLVAAAEAGATAAIQPGGSVRDAEVIAAANERGLAMVFTGKRHFRH
ncbi:MAG TPA: bifunctional phosphoribosylaminoimidazolecarboxamide formyltransferase/IMP cyclohydrolase [Rubricoccaceae bacterium]|nr:bifunctional phosphoribosylaminoimidazolecarboxamide formyltransferase/IMP cyclohydrolase [Rubricoccaceae bacterium]